MHRAEMDGIDAGLLRARVAIHEAFDKARRQLQDAVRRQRGAVKNREERDARVSASEQQFVEATIAREKPRRL